MTDVSYNYKLLKKMKLFGSTRKLKDKTKNAENLLSLEVVEIVLINVT